MCVCVCAGGKTGLIDKRPRAYCWQSAYSSADEREGRRRCASINVMIRAEKLQIGVKWAAAVWGAI